MITTQENAPVETKAYRSPKLTSVGITLKAARERLNISEKDAGLRLHLKPKIIAILESEHPENALPAIFLRGYVKSYAKLLEFSDEQIVELLNQLEVLPPEPTMPKRREQMIDNDSHYGWLTPFVILALVGMAAMWWNSHDHSFSLTPATPDANATVETTTNTNAAPAEPSITTPSQAQQPLQDQTPKETAPLAADPIAPNNNTLIENDSHIETNTTTEPALNTGTPATQAPITTDTMGALPENTQNTADSVNVPNEQNALKTPEKKVKRTPTKYNSNRTQMDLPEPSFESDF